MNAGSNRMTGRVLNEILKELPSGEDWAIVVDSGEQIAPHRSPALRAATTKAAESVHAIIAADPSTAPFDRWKVLPPLAAALIPNVDFALVAAIRRGDGDLFRDVSQPIRDAVIRCAAKNQIAVIDCSLDSNSDEMARQRPELHPKAPGGEMRWLAEHLERATDADLFPQVASPADATAFRAGLWQINDFLDTSHEHSQSVEGAGRNGCGDYWHAIMHRREPDPSNSKYWYRRVGQHLVFPSLVEHAETVFAAAPAVADRWRNKVITDGSWDPYAFVDFCEAAVRSGDSKEVRTAERIQWLEMLLLLEATHRDAIGG